MRSSDSYYVIPFKNSLSNTAYITSAIIPPFQKKNGKIVFAVNMQRVEEPRQAVLLLK